jgi:hypothetical protein
MRMRRVESDIAVVRTALVGFNAVRAWSEIWA